MKSRIKAKTIAMGILIAVAVIITISVAVHYANSVNISKYILDDLVLEGYNGYGNFEKWDFIDGEALVDDLGETKYEGICNSSGNDPLADNIYISIEGDHTQLSNGDQVTVTISVNYNKINSYDFNTKLRGDKEIRKTYTVSGLSDPVTVDPFEVIERVEYKFGKYNIVYNTNYSKNYDSFYTKYENERLKFYEVNGSSDPDEVGKISFSITESSADNVTVECKTQSNYGWDEYMYKGANLATESKDFTPVIWTIVTNVDEISKEQIDALVKKVIPILKEYRPSLTDVKFNGDAFMSHQKSIWGGTVHSTNLLFSATKNGEEYSIAARVSNVTVLNNEVDFDKFFDDYGYTGSNAYNKFLDKYNSSSYYEKIPY